MYNTGNRNTGYCNTGDYNTGDWNTGYCNTGDYNTGNCNTGYYNTGNWNTGNWNTGNWNTGNCNTGYYNTGNWNTGNWNTGNWNTGYCNTGDRNVMLFDHETTFTFDCKTMVEFRNRVQRLLNPLCEWVSDINMSEEEKEKYPTYKTTGGYLKVNENMRNDTHITKEDEEFFRSLPYFDEAKFLECTGIDLSNPKVKIIIDGKEIWISKESADSLKAQL